MSCQPSWHSKKSCEWHEERDLVKHWSHVSLEFIKCVSSGSDVWCGHWNSQRILCETCHCEFILCVNVCLCYVWIYVMCFHISCIEFSLSMNYNEDTSDCIILNSDVYNSVWKKINCNYNDDDDDNDDNDDDDDNIALGAFVEIYVYIIWFWFVLKTCSTYCVAVAFVWCSIQLCLCENLGLDFDVPTAVTAVTSIFTLDKSSQLMGRWGGGGGGEAITLIHT